MVGGFVGACIGWCAGRCVGGSSGKGRGRHGSGCRRGRLVGGGVGPSGGAGGAGRGGLGDELACYACPVGEPAWVGDTVRAYRLASAKAGLLRAVLAGAGFTSGDFPGLAAGLDGDGRPVVVLGPVTTATAVRLARVVARSKGPDGGCAA